MTPRHDTTLGATLAFAVLCFGCETFADLDSVDLSAANGVRSDGGSSDLGPPGDTLDATPLSDALTGDAADTSDSSLVDADADSAMGPPRLVRRVRRFDFSLSGNNSARQVLDLEGDWDWDLEQTVPFLSASHTDGAGAGHDLLIDVEFVTGATQGVALERGRGSMPFFGGDAFGGVTLVEFGEGVAVEDGAFTIEASFDVETVPVAGVVAADTFLVFWSQTRAISNLRQDFGVRGELADGELRFHRRGTGAGAEVITGHWWLVESDEFFDVQHTAEPDWAELTDNFGVTLSAPAFALYSFTSAAPSTGAHELVDCYVIPGDVRCLRGSNAAVVDLGIQVVSLLDGVSDSTRISLPFEDGDGTSDSGVTGVGRRSMLWPGSLSEAGLVRSPSTSDLAPAASHADVSLMDAATARATRGSSMGTALNTVELIHWAR